MVASLTMKKNLLVDSSRSLGLAIMQYDSHEAAVLHPLNSLLPRL